MTATGAKRPRVQEGIRARLARAIASREFAPGEHLPPEADLAVQLGVSRTALREAVKGLEAKYMVRSKPRVGTVVLPQEDWALLDQDVLSWVADLLDVRLFTQSVLEARRAIEPAAAVLACRRASLSDLANIERALDGMQASEGDPGVFTDHDLAFHERLLNASHNAVFMQFVHTIRAGLNMMLLASNKSVDDYTRTVQSHRALLDALVARDETAAEACSLALLQHATEDLGRLHVKG
jgi:GntR family transcriptional regulator, galactonate operon transcriptional repressor|tara:strand:- start:1144 stop:1857 length:714 start_codon:yes stop_codon:yes gene_type:complete